MSFKDRWQYPHGDPSVHLFDCAVKDFGLNLPLGATVLEVGCNETDFSKWLLQADPTATVIGCDVNPSDGFVGEFRQQPAETLEIAPGSLDAVIGLGSIEHFGLGFYDDPINDTADMEVTAAVERWLKPGGWFYYDVPWTPSEGYITANRHFRVYDDAQLQARLTGGLQPMGRFYAHGETAKAQWARPASPISPFWYVVRWLRKCL